jgi:hypothetical protein
MEYPMTSETVELAYVALFAYGLHRTVDFLKYRLDVLGKDARFFVPRDEQEPGGTGSSCRRGAGY